jgi:archaellum component FlaC
MFASRAEVENLKDMVKSMSRSVEDLTTEVKLLREEVERLRR